MALKITLMLGAFLVPFSWISAGHTPSNYQADGWQEWRYAYLGPSTKCAADEVEHSVLLMEQDTDAPITSPTNVKAYYWARDNSVNFFNSSAIYDYLNYAGNIPSFCAPYDAFVGIGVHTNGTAYQNPDFYSMRPLDPLRRIDEQGKHFMHHVHLKRTTDPVTNTAWPISPRNVILNVDPTYTFRIFEISGLLGGNTFDQFRFELGDGGGNTLTRIKYPATAASNLPGQITLPALGLADGYYGWDTATDMLSTITVDGYGYNNQPTSATFNQTPQFLLDTALPTGNITRSVGTASSVTVPVTFTTTQQDVLSGLQNSTFFIKDLNTNSIASVSQNYTVGANLLGGPKNLQQYSVSTTLNLGVSYEFWIEVTDAAGNTLKTPVQTYTAPDPLPTECNDDMNNDPAEDNDIDEFDSGCWTDPTDPSTYDPTDDDESYVPPPPLPPSMSLTASPTLVRRGESTNLTWSVTPSTNVTNCTITGLGSVGSSGSQPSAPITGRTTITLSCDVSGSTITTSTKVESTYISTET